MAIKYRRGVSTNAAGIMRWQSFDARLARFHARSARQAGDALAFGELSLLNGMTTTSSPERVIWAQNDVAARRRYYSEEARWPTNVEMSAWENGALAQPASIARQWRRRPCARRCGIRRASPMTSHLATGNCAAHGVRFRAR